MKYSIDSIKNNINKKIYSPLYLIYGDEPFFIDEVSELMINNILTEDEKDFNQHIFYGKDSNIIDILGTCKQYPMMGDKQFVILKEGQDIDLKKDENVKHLIAYTENPQPSTIFAICFKYKKPPAKIVKIFENNENAVCCEVKKMYDNQIPQWLNNRVAQKGYKINNKAVNLIVEFVGNDLEKIENEIDKLIINIDSKEVINEKHIEKYIGISKDFNVFELISALSLKNVYKANLIAIHFDKNPNENPIFKTLPMLFSHFNKLLLAHSLPNKSEKEIVSKFKLNYYNKNEFFVAMRNYPLKKTVRIISYIRECATKALGVENNTATHGELLKELIFKILH
ncbi:MAG: DNA polymerase III subunit delta [Bacteroidales bacterium]|jgi:DNA polymerase-3 subunit delta